jgi:hypothetical protein
MNEWTSSRQLPANVRRLPPRPDLPVLPGWYTIDQPHNVQAYWNGFEWSRTRQWRGVGWLEHGVGLEDGGGDGLGLSDGGVDGALGGQLTLVRQTPATGIEALTRPVPLPREPLPALAPVAVPVALPSSDDVTTFSTPTATAGDLATSSPATSPVLYRFPSPSTKITSDASTTTSPPIPRTNPMAIASLVLSVLGLLGVGSVLGIILGAKARRQVRMSHGTQNGDRLALAGIVVGICTLAIAVVVVTLWLIALANYSSHLSHLDLSPGSGS